MSKTLKYHSYAGITTYNPAPDSYIPGKRPILTLFSSTVALENGILGGYEVIVVKQAGETYDDFLDRTDRIANLICKE